MRSFFIFILISLFTINLSFSQSRYRFQSRFFKKERHRIFISIGATNFLGDLGGANRIGSGKGSLRDFDIQAIKPAFQIGYNYRLSKFMAIRSAFTYAWLSGNDAYTTETFRQNRNLNFRTPIYELSSAFEVIWEIKRKGHQYYLKGVKGWTNYRYATYIYGGLALSYFNSKAKYGDTWYALRPLSTEGEGIVPTRKRYSPVQFTIPLGIGVKVRISKTLEIGIEYTARIGFSDYIDDVSTTYFDPVAIKSANGAKGDLAAEIANPALQKNPTDPLYRSTIAGQQRGNPNNKDSYLAVMVSMYYTIGKGFIPRLRNTHRLRYR
jgi:hypothetical protein